MKTFTYRDYIKCIHTLRLNAVFKLAEEESNYKIQENERNNTYKQKIKNSLRNKEEMAKFLNDFLNPKVKIKSEHLVRYESKEIASKYKLKEVDIIYKLKKQEILFLVEIQPKIKGSTPYKLLNYCIDIMHEYSKERKKGNDTIMPIIVPIIIYIGNEKWKISNNKKQISDYIFENYELDFNYNIIEVNKISNKTLLDKKGLFTNTIILERLKNN